ncbi:MAG: thioredoxin domain-containing protein [Acidimicrobiia bacterium]|nr:thioredoxin domain-containing protein [Acidimicrobiia bacterium]
MDRLLIVVGLVAVAALVAVWAQRRRPSAPVRTGYDTPDHLDRGDFDRPEAPWLVAVFSSATCAKCAATWEKARHLESADVAVQEIEATVHRELHARYNIEAVPLIVVVDAEGTRRASFLGPPRTDELWASMAELRDEDRLG